MLGDNITKSATQIDPAVGEQASEPEGCVEDTGRSIQEGGKARLQAEKGDRCRVASLSGAPE